MTSRFHRGVGSLFLGLLLWGAWTATAMAADNAAPAWADNSPFLSSISPELKARCRAILQSPAGKKRAVGRMGQFGDSITAQNAYFRRPLVRGIANNETGHDYNPIRAWLCGGTLPAEAQNWYHNYGKLEDFGNRGGWTLRDAVKWGHPKHALDIGGVYASQPPVAQPGNFSWAIVMFGTNDMRTPDWDPVVWKPEYKAFLQACIDHGCIPVISTIPPQHENMANGKVAQVNRIVNQLAQELQIPLIDFFGLILHHQPGDAWDGKRHGEHRLISDDGTHPNTDSTYAMNFSRVALTTDNGYGARTKLAFDMAEKMKTIVFEDGPADAGRLTLLPAAPPPGRVGQPFAYTVKTIHGAGAIACSQSGGSLPPGLTLNAQGEMTGTPIQAGAYSVIVKANDEQRSAEIEMVLEITPPAAN